MHRLHEWRDWPFRGPRAVMELFNGIASSGLGLSAYANHYIQVSGVSPNSSVAHELRTHMSILRHMVEVD